MCVLFLFFVWGRVLELTCHFEIGNVKNHSCVPIACIMCALWVILSSWLRGKKKKPKPEFSSFFWYQFGSVHFFQFLSNVLCRYMVGMHEVSVWSCLWEPERLMGLGDERMEQKGKRCWVFLHSSKGTGWMGRVRVWRAAWLTPSPWSLLRLYATFSAFLCVKGACL